MTAAQLLSNTLKKRFLLIVLCAMLTACSGHQVKQDSLILAHQTFYDDYEPNLEKFNREINQSLILRKGAVGFYTQEILESDAQYFNANDIQRIHTTVAEYKRNRDVLLNEIAYRYRKLIENVEISFDLAEPSGLVNYPSLFSLGGKNVLYVNPLDEKGRQYINVIKLGLAATLTLYDNFIIAIMPYQENGHFRRNVNYDNIDNQKIIEEISGNFRRLDNYKDTLRVVEFNDSILKWEKLNPDNTGLLDKDTDYFDVLIEGSYTNKRIKEITLFDRLGFRTVRFRRILRDAMFDFGNATMNMVSKVFGNSMGLISSREGYLKNISPEHLGKIKSELVAGDILLEKTPFRLTDRFIPGHWGHVAIWVGTEKELKELGVWDELPAIYAKAKKRLNYQGPSFQQQIRSDNKIVEALRPGVQINSLEHFLDIDDMAVLRDNKASKSSMKRYILRAFEQIGKEYDFNFDVETDRKIVCSELAFVAYDDYEWPVEKTAGRYTISPDHVGVKANGDGPFTPVMLYHDGKKIERRIQTNFNHLMNAEYDAVQGDLMLVE